MYDYFYLIQCEIRAKKRWMEDLLSVLWSGLHSLFGKSFSERDEMLKQPTRASEGVGCNRIKLVSPASGRARYL